MAGGRAELVDARAQVYPDAFPEGGVGNLYCQFSSESGMTFSVGVLANTAEDFAATSTERNRAVWELVPDDYLIEDFQSGVLEGYTNTHESATLQEFTLNAGSGRLLLTIALIADPGTFANTDAIAVVDAIAARTVERFAEYR
ncbi:hypothetical protein SAMN05216270_107136 [Glycomyces harbinensis]|uniref:Uncharacterized protein n=2 Tax=Glycomyces harbinensis TaxID=58114 RepID=A0A1G6XHJ8_9ACTN|nr:hypothetical protein SAMN05216270_107136 [Glycomyces harbinensis]